MYSPELELALKVLEDMGRDYQQVADEAYSKDIAFVASEIADVLARARRAVIHEVEKHGGHDNKDKPQSPDSVIRAFIEKHPTRKDLDPPYPLDLEA